MYNCTHNSSNIFLVCKLHNYSLIAALHFMHIFSKPLFDKWILSSTKSVSSISLFLINITFLTSRRSFEISSLIISFPLEPISSKSFSSNLGRIMEMMTFIVGYLAINFLIIMLKLYAKYFKSFFLSETDFQGWL